MNRHLMALAGIGAALVLVAGCGKKGPLEPPPGAPASAREVPEAAPQAADMDRMIDPLDGPATTPQWPGTSSSIGGPR